MAPQDFLKIAEDIAGMPYVWGRYDLLCLPGSFPYGGMENPCLTFVTPTLLAGDRSLADVVAHEIAHSWTGNLVSKSWAAPRQQICLDVSSLEFCLLWCQCACVFGANTNSFPLWSDSKCHLGSLLAERRMDDLVPKENHGSNP